MEKDIQLFDETIAGLDELQKIANLDPGLESLPLSSLQEINGYWKILFEKVDETQKSIDKQGIQIIGGEEASRKVNISGNVQDSNDLLEYCKNGSGNVT